MFEFHSYYIDCSTFSPYFWNSYTQPVKRKSKLIMYKSKPTYEIPQGAYISKLININFLNNITLKQIKNNIKSNSLKSIYDFNDFILPIDDPNNPNKVINLKIDECFLKNIFMEFMIHNNRYLS